MNKSYKIIFIGTPEFSIPILKALIEKGFKPIAVICEPDRPKGRKKILTAPPVKLLAEQNNIPVFQPNKISAITLKIKNLHPDLIIVAAYGQIIPQEILDIPKFGALNIHPSLLPKYRGASPIQNTILNNEKQTGTTIIRMDANMDHGDIVISSNVKCQMSKITYPDLADKLSDLSAKLLIDILPKYFAGKIKPWTQDHSKATFTKLLKKEDGLLSLGEKPEIIERKIRAYFPWPGTYFLVDNKRFIIKKAHLKNNKIAIDVIQPEGKTKMSFTDFVRGYKGILTKLPKWVKI